MGPNTVKYVDSPQRPICFINTYWNRCILSNYIWFEAWCMHNSDLEIIISHEWGMINFDKETIKCHRCRLYITSFDVQQRGRYAGGSNTMVNVSMFLPCQQGNKISEKGRSGSKKWFPKSVAQGKKKTQHNLMCLKSWNFHKNSRWQKITFFITEKVTSYNHEKSR
jgi:hypothetical protein